MKKSFKHQQIYRKCFPGVNANDLNYHIVPTLVEHKLDNVVAHAVVNDVLNGADHDN